MTPEQIEKVEGLKHCLLNETVPTESEKSNLIYLINIIEEQELANHTKDLLLLEWATMFHTSAVVFSRFPCLVVFIDWLSQYVGKSDA
jgi:hypothetical protein